MKDEYGFLGITPEHVETAADIQQRLEKRLRSVTITVTAKRSSVFSRHVDYEIVATAKQDFFVGGRIVISDTEWKLGNKEHYLEYIATAMARYLGNAAFLADGGQ
jgi:hypothetical protein